MLIKKAILCPSPFFKLQYVCTNFKTKSDSMNPKVDEFISKSDRWQAEMKKLRAILLNCGLKEEIKWHQPCYTFEGNNVVIIGNFSDGCRLSFFKGALLKDPEDILEKPGPNTRSGRLISFTDVQQIVEMEPVIKAYIKEAVEAEKKGLKVDFKKNRLPDLPEELLEKFEENPEFEAAFEALTPGRKRGYLLHFSSAKQSKTRTRRIEKYMDKIFEGKGMNDWKA